MAIYIQPATAEHVDAICDIMRECVEALERPEFFVDDEREEMARRADGDEGFILLARCGADIAGFLMIDIPGVAERNLGRDLGWPEEWLDSAAHIDTACVRPAHRGLGLQKKLVAEAEARLRDMGIVRYLATIHPENVASLASMRALG